MAAVGAAENPKRARVRAWRGRSPYSENAPLTLHLRLILLAQLPELPIHSPLASSGCVNQKQSLQIGLQRPLVTQVAGGIRVETGAHFATGDATLGEEDKPLLDDFAKAITSSHSDAVITVEGFADPAGSTAFNQRLGMRRAEAVRDYPVGTAGMQAGQVRAVSYGEATNRQVRPGATGDEGRDNRRVSLVVDYAGGGQSMPAAPMQPVEPAETTEPPPTPET
jgi:outer membrane protein OmpA-like peptidoglycan-associated protein